MDNCHGLVVASEVTPVDGYGERAAAVRMARVLPGVHQTTLVAYKGYDTRDCVADLRTSGITLPVAQNIEVRRRFAIDGRMFYHKSYAQLIIARRRIQRRIAGTNRPRDWGSSKPVGDHGSER